eukprot:COSAG04_NODE_5206_length_1703_cov_1.670200_1_plen_219_part_10
MRPAKVIRTNIPEMGCVGPVISGMFVRTGFGRGWCNNRPCLPGRDRFFFQPGGLAGASSSFIIGGTHGPWKTESEAQRWADAGFLLTSVPASAASSDALALTLAHSTSYGMFVLVAPDSAGVIDASTVVDLAESFSCHTNFAGFVLAPASSLQASDTAAVVAAADAQRSVAFWTLPLVLGVPDAQTVAHLGDLNAPFSAIVLRSAEAGEGAHKWAQRAV